MQVGGQTAASLLPFTTTCDAYQSVISRVPLPQESCVNAIYCLAATGTALEGNVALTGNYFVFQCGESWMSLAAAGALQKLVESVLNKYTGLIWICPEFSFLTGFGILRQIRQDLPPSSGVCCQPR